MTDLSTLSTKQDLAKVESRLEAKIEKLDAKIDSVNTSLNAKIDSVKSELKSDFSRLAVEVFKSQAEIREMRAEMSTKADMNRLFNYFDSITGTVSNYQKQDMARKDTIAKHDEAIEDHEKRLTLLEN